MKKGLTTLALAILLAAAGCGGSESPPPTTSGPPAGEGATEGGRVLVDIRDLQFQPSEVTAPAGATVVFTNSDQVSHTVTKESGPGPDFDSGPIEPGGTFSQVFPAKGEVEIVDSQRPETKLTLTIE